MWLAKCPKKTASIFFGSKSCVMGNMFTLPRIRKFLEFRRRKHLSGKRN